MNEVNKYAVGDEVMHDGKMRIVMHVEYKYHKDGAGFFYKLNDDKKWYSENELRWTTISIDIINVRIRREV